MGFDMLTRGRSVFADSKSAEEGALWGFLCSGSVAVPLSSVCEGIIPPFLVVDMTEVDIVETLLCSNA